MKQTTLDSCSTVELVQSVLEALNQGEILLQGLSDELYVRKLPAAFNASIGGHYRHCLDHFRGLLEAAKAGDLNYDRRVRGTPVEMDRSAALAATRELRDGFQQLSPSLLERTLTVTCKTSYTSSASQASASTVGREIMYSVAHAVHHYALIGFMAGTMGCTLPSGFGFAPSTLKYQADAATAAA